jgi:hypothetical protein
MMRGDVPMHERTVVSGVLPIGVNVFRRQHGEPGDPDDCGERGDKP